MWDMSELEELKAELSALRARVRLLEDRAEIGQLVAEYGPAVDSGSADEAAQLWTEDGVYSVVGGEVPFDMNGRNEIHDMVSGHLHQNTIAQGCGHILTAPHIEVNGDEARGRSHAMLIRWEAEAGRFYVYRLSANEWNLKRTDAGWKLVRRTNANLDGAAVARSLLAPR
jgi:hypothetical protein